MIETANDNIKIAIPNKGRLKEPTIELLKQAGFSFRVRDRALYATCTNYPITFVFLRADDIPVLVEKGVVSLGITGEDLVIEREAKVETFLPLEFGKCRLCVAVPQALNLEAGFEYFQGRTIATSFPKIATDYFKKHGVEIDCVEMSGSVEIMVALGLADGIVDIVETGDSLKANKLVVHSEIGKYQTVLIAHLGATEKNPLLAKIKRRIEGVLIARKYSVLEYNLPKAKLAEAHQITPGFESPTISQLENPDWVAIKVMAYKKEVVHIMDQLEAIGATGIMETEIRNCRM